MLLLAPGALAAKTRVNAVGGEVSGVLGSAFNTPRGLAINESGAGGVPAGTFYVVDAANFRVQQFTPAGTFVRAWGWGVRSGSKEFEVCSTAALCQRGVDPNGNGQGAGAGQFKAPRGIAVDQSNGLIYVTDQGSRRVSIFGPNGNFIGAFGWGALNGAASFQYCTAVSGCSVPNSSTSGGQAGKFGGEIGYPAVSPSGSVYVADVTNRRVDVFTPTIVGGTVTSVAFLRAFGFDVSTAAGTGFEVCTGANCKSGTTGSGLGQFGAGGPSQLAISSTGTTYAFDPGNKRIEEFDSTPAPLSATFGSAALTAAFGASPTLQAIGLDRASNHLYVAGKRAASAQRVAVVELTSAGAAVGTHGLDLNATSANGVAAAPAALGGNIYLSTESEGQRVLVLNEAPTANAVTTFTGTTAEFTGLVVSNGFEVGYHFEYSTDGTTWTKVPASDAEATPGPGTVAVAQSVQGLTGSQLYRVRLVQNRPSGGGVAISPEVTFTTAAALPTIAATAASEVSDSSAVLNAKLNPQNQATSYHFEYGAADCSLNPCASLPAQQLSGGNTGIAVAQGVNGLQPATAYHFRLVATNGAGETKGPDATFETLAEGASLPDDRGYELVSPADTNGLFLGALSANYSNFLTPLASPDGESVIFYSEGTLPGTNGNGTIDAYEATRSTAGWSTDIISPSGAEAVAPAAGGASADHRYAFWNSGTNGGVLDEGTFEGTALLRNPDGTFELIGIGSLGEDPEVEGRWITPGASHVIFSTKPGFAVQLEPEAPAALTAAIYDRTPGGATHVVSLLPGEVTPTADATYLRASADGSAVAFEVEGTLYERRDNTETLEVAPGGPTFAGISANGDRVFYLLAGDLFEFDADAETTTPIGSGGESTVVNVSADGSHVYFSSPQQLDGAEGEPGEPNLYVWDGAAVNFVAVLDPQDFISFAGKSLVNLGKWTTAMGTLQTNETGFAMDPSRTTPDGSALVFQSHGVTGYPYDSAGFSEIYRYDAADESLTCISCSAIAPAGSEAELQSTGLTVVNSPTNVQSLVQNVTDDGSMVFFQTGDPLVPEDTDGLNDVYRWKQGQSALISSGRSTNPDFLYAMTADGANVFFKTGDRLVPEDETGGSGSIYDARVGGGFASAQVETEGCLEASCQGPGTAPPALSAAGSDSFQGPGNAKPNRKGRKHHKKSHKHHKKSHKHHKKKGKKQNKGNGNGNRASHNRGGAK